MSAQARFDFAVTLPRPVSAAALRALALGAPDGDTRAHIERAARLVEMGRGSDAVDYMRKRALGGLQHARELKGRQEAWCRYERERVLDRALVFVQAERLAVKAAPSVRGRLDVPVLYETPEYAGQTVAEYVREVTNPHWPELTSHGVWVQVGGYQALGKKWKVELQCLPPDAERTQHVIVRLVATREEAMQLARRWAALGEALIEATS
jgi:hypothetical protein